MKVMIGRKSFLCFADFCVKKKFLRCIDLQLCAIHFSSSACTAEVRFCVKSALDLVCKSWSKCVKWLVVNYPYFRYPTITDLIWVVRKSFRCKNSLNKLGLCSPKMLKIFYRVLCKVFLLSVAGKRI